jgi:hypothetical protein
VEGTNEARGVCPCRCACGLACDHATCPCDDCVAARTPRAPATSSASNAPAGSDRRTYAERRAARIERLHARAARLASEGAAATDAGFAALDRIPLGQPILIGHHSEGRDRRYRARAVGKIERGIALSREAQETARRASNAEASNAVSSDDPDAIDKLRAQLDEARALHARTLDVNARLRKGETCDVDAEMGWSAGRWGIVRSLGNRTVPTTNGAANVRRIEARIGELERRAAAPALAPVVVGAVRIEECDNRVRLVFAGKPADDVRATLKSHGFRWSPSEGAWQRMATEDARYWARKIAGAL